MMTIEVPREVIAQILALSPFDLETAVTAIISGSEVLTMTFNNDAAQLRRLDENAIIPKPEETDEKIKTLRETFERRQTSLLCVSQALINLSDFIVESGKEIKQPDKG